jgi:spore maturation protein CgeB
MKILFFESGKLWSYGLPAGFRDLGHTVRMSGPLTKRNIPIILSSFRPDLIITIGWGPEHTKQKQIWMCQYSKAAGIPLVYWATEDPNFTKVFSLPLIKRMKPNYVFTISSKTARTYRKLGIPASHMDFAYHPSIHRGIKPIKKYKSNIAVVANGYPNVLDNYPNLFRRKALNTLIRPLLQKGMRIDFYGRNWGKMKPFLGIDIPKEWIHGYIPYKDANKVYSSAKIILGLQNYTDMVTQRTYEILGSGGFLLTCNTLGVRKLVKPGRDVIVTSSARETIALVRRYLRNSKERERIRRQGRLSIKRHSYTKRAQYMLSVLRREGILKTIR